MDEFSLSFTAYGYPAGHPRDRTTPTLKPIMRYEGINCIGRAYKTKDEYRLGNNHVPKGKFDIY